MQNLKYSYVYIITNTVKNKHYIGWKKFKCITTDSLGISYFSSAPSNRELKTDLSSNFEHFTFKIIAKFDYDDWEKAKELERKLHKIHDVGKNPNFYNLRNEFYYNVVFTGQKHSQKTKDKISKRFSGVNHNLYGKTHSAESKAKMSKAHKGKKLTTEHIEKIKASSRGRCHSECTKKLLSDIKSGINNYRAKLANIYNYHTNKLIAEQVVIREWCRLHPQYGQAALSKTARSNKSLPSTSKNPHQHKGIYAEYV